ncbi:MAG TPA: TlpA disulfide reductase family protein [Candidatus Eisenbacteria bacterium]
MGLGTLITALALAWGCTRQEGEKGKPVVSKESGEVGSQAPEFALPDLSGKTVRLADFKGKVVILDFWATWCPPCRAEVPDFVRLQAKYRDKGLSVVGLSLDAEGAKAVRPFAEEYNVNYVMLLANDETARSFGGVVGIPTTFVLDRTGKIVSKFIGKTELKVFEETILPLLSS